MAKKKVVKIDGLKQAKKEIEQLRYTIGYRDGEINYLTKEVIKLKEDLRFEINKFLKIEKSFIYRLFLKKKIEKWEKENGR